LSNIHSLFNFSSLVAMAEEAHRLYRQRGEGGGDSESKVK